LTGRDLAALILLGVLWGASLLFIRVAVPVFGPFALVELRVAIAVVALLVYGVAIGRLPKARAHWRRFLILGLVGFRGLSQRLVARVVRPTWDQPSGGRIYR